MPHWITATLLFYGSLFAVVGMAAPGAWMQSTFGTGAAVAMIIGAALLAAPVGFYVMLRKLK